MNILKINNLILLSIFKMLPKFITLISIKKNQMILQINHTSISSTFFFLKNYTNTQLDYLSDICGVDFPKRISRFEIVYN